MSNLGSISRLYQNSVLSKPIEVQERALPVYVNLGDLYSTQILKTEYLDTPIELTEEYLTILQVLEEEAEARERNNPTPKPFGPYRLTLNQRRAIFDTMSKEQYNNILTNKAAAKSFAAQVATVQRNDKYNKALRDSLGLEEGVDSPADGGGPPDIDYIKYIRSTGITDPAALNKVYQFILGAKAQGIWNNMVAWPMISSLNAGKGTTVYSLGGLGSYNATFAGTVLPTWQTDGILLSGSGGQFNTTITQGYNQYSAGVIYAQQLPYPTSTTGNWLGASNSTPEYLYWLNPNTGFGGEYRYNGSNLRISDNTLTTMSMFSVVGGVGLNTKAYINGAIAGTAGTTGTTPASLTLSSPLILGRGDDGFQGTVSFAFIFNTALSDSQMTSFYDLYNNTLGSGPDPDAAAFIAKANITNPTYQNRIINFVTGIKNLGLWFNMVAWPMRQTLNAGSGSTVYSLGGYGTYNGAMNGSAKWTPGGITFTGTSDYIDYGTFNVAVSSGGFNVHTLFSGMGVPVTNYSVASDSFYPFAESSLGTTRFYITNGVNGQNTWCFQARDLNGYRIYDTTDYQTQVAYDIGYSFIADNAFVPTLSTSSFQYNGVTTPTPYSIRKAATTVVNNGNYVMRTIGRTNTTNAPYPNSRISYLLAFAPGIGMTSQTMSAVYTLCQNTLNQGDPDVEAYVAATGATDSTISTFVSGIKAQGIWYNMVSWPLISTQNRGTGSVAYPLGGLYGGGSALNTTLSGKIVNGATWGLSGINFVPSSNAYIDCTNSSQSLFNAGSAFAFFDVASNTDTSLSKRTAVITYGNTNTNNKHYVHEYPNYSNNTEMLETGWASINFTENTGLHLSMGGLSSMSTPGSFVNAGQTNTTNYTSLSDNTHGSYNAGSDPLIIGRQATIGTTFNGPISFVMCFTNTSPTSSLYTNINSLYKSTLGANLNLP